MMNSRRLEEIVKNGAIPTRYKAMGSSPRIMPVAFGHSINAVKSRLREEYYKQLANARSGFATLRASI
jgi:hypothetical protein